MLLYVEYIDSALMISNDVVFNMTPDSKPVAGGGGGGQRSRLHRYLDVCISNKNDYTVILKKKYTYFLFLHDF